MGGAVWPACVRHCKVDCNTTLGRCVVLALLLLPYISCITAEGIKYGGVPYSILPSEGPEEDASMQQWLPCWAEQGQGSPRHEALLAMLNGRKLAFVGDSLTRYQYLELAYYIINGRCPDPEKPGDNGFILNLYTYKSIDDFHQRSPKAITKDTKDVFAKEYLFGSRVSMQHGYSKEDRSFIYTDKKGRVIEMVYLQYFHELYCRLAQRLLSASNFRPTDVFLNFGVWFVLPEARNTTCGDIVDEESKCPYMPSLCEYFEKDHDFNLYWMASSPSRDTDESIELNYNIGPGHNLNPITRCDMSKVGVVDREEMIRMLVPEKSKRYELFWDRHHFKTSDPYHAMNWDLANEIRKKDSWQFPRQCGSNLNSGTEQLDNPLQESGNLAELEKKRMHA